MPQLIVNMKVNTQNKDCGNLKNNRFKLRHAPYSNRCIQLVKMAFEHIKKVKK